MSEPQDFELYRLTRQERRLASFAYGRSYEWAIEHADPLDNPERLADTFTERPWILGDLERDTLALSPRETEIVRAWFLAGINAGLHRQDELSRQNHARFARTVQGFVGQGALSYAELTARRKVVVANV